jgi:hypothetical protein
MFCAVVLCIGLLAGEVAEYSRPLGLEKLDQATIDIEGYGKKEAFRREYDGLRIKLAPGDPETGWKTPQALRIGGDFTITASLVLGTLPKPAQEDGVAVGIAIATQNHDQPEATLLRLVEMDGTPVYRAISKAGNMMPGGPQMMAVEMGMMMQQPGGKPPKPPRPTFPAKGREVRFELRRIGPNVEYAVVDAESQTPRYLGQVALGTNDIVGVKLFASNRNGGDAVEALLQGLAIRADRITGLGTAVRTVFGEVVHGDPTAIEGGMLLVGGPSASPQPGAPNAAPPASVPMSGRMMTAAPEGATVAVAVVEVAAAPAAAAPPPAAAVAQVAAAPPPPPGASPAPAPAGPDSPPSAAAGARPAEPPKPKARLPLDEVESIVFDRALAVSGRFVGQPNVDLAGPRDKAKPAETKPDEKPKEEPPKAAPKADDLLAPPPGTVAPTRVPKVDPQPSGIRDLHFVLSGLRAAEIKQVQVQGQTDKGATSWRLDTSDSTDWPLVIRRAGTESWADLFLEPPDGDAHQKSFTFNLTYADGQNGNANVQVGEHTDPKLAYDASAPEQAPDARVFLAGDEQLFGKLEGLDGETLRLTTPWGDKLAVPLARVAGLYMGLADHKESPESFARRLKSRGTEDLLLARSKDGEVVAIAGVAEGTEAGKLRFNFQEKTRTLPLKQVEGLVLASRPVPARPDELWPTFTLAGGLVVSGKWKALDGTTWNVETAWGQELKLPAAEVQSVRFRGGQMSYLSDLTPSEVEETPYFGRRVPWRLDVNLVGEPLKMDGTTYARGLAVHSRTVLTYDLGGRYSWFETRIGFDEASQGRGRVDCRVVADGKELYANPDLRADAPPEKLAAAVAGVQRLQLVVDFGEDQDAGDRVIWAEPRLFRRYPAGQAPLPANPFATTPPPETTPAPEGGR